MAYDLDPALLDFLRRRQGGEVAPTAEAPAPVLDIPPPAGRISAAPAPAPITTLAQTRNPLSSLDPQVIDFLQKHDASASEYNDKRDLDEGIGRSMNYFLRKPVSAGFPARKVDDEMQKFLIHQSTLRGYASANDPMHAPPTEDHIRRAIAGGMPEGVARGAPTLGSLVAIYDRKPDRVAPEFNPTEDYIKRGAALKRPVLPQPGEKAVDFAKRVEGQERDEQLAKDRAAAVGQNDVTLSPAAQRLAAERYLTTGESPNLGMGRSGGKAKASILNLAGELAPDTNLAGATAGYKSTTKSLGELQAQADKVNAFERTALANLDTFLGQAKKVRDTGSPLLNKGGRAFDESVMGDPNMAAFSAARQTAVNEIGKILSGSMGNAGLSDSARHEVEALMGPNATVAQLMAAAEILKRDMHNRKVSVEAELQIVRDRAGRRPGAKPEAEQGSADPLGIR
jgi:hypothetical protein